MGSEMCIRDRLKYLYILGMSHHHILDSLSLVPSSIISEQVRRNSNTIEESVIVIDLSLRISPSISNSYSFKVYASLSKESFVLDDS